MKKILVILVIFIGLQSCNWRHNKIIPNIGLLLENSTHYDGKSVRVKGEVSEVFNFFGEKGFFLRDETGEILILIKKSSLPDKNTRVLVIGTFREAIRIGDLSLSVIEAKRIKNIK